MRAAERAAFTLAGVAVWAIVGLPIAAIWTGDGRYWWSLIPAGTALVVFAIAGAMLAGQREDRARAATEHVEHFEGLPPRPPLMRRHVRPVDDETEEVALARAEADKRRQTGGSFKPYPPR